MSTFYSKHLGPKLSERVRELLDHPHDVQISLYEELAVARASACEAFKLCQPLWDDKVTLKDETRALMIDTLGTAMTNVKELVLAASKLEKDAGDKVSVKVINLVVMQIVMAINDVCGTEHLALAEAIGRSIDERVRLPMNEKLNPTIRVQIGSREVTDE